MAKWPISSLSIKLNGIAVTLPLIKNGKNVYYYIKRFFVVLLVSIIGFANQAYSAARASDDVIYTFGVVPQFDTRQTLLVWGPLLTELEKSTGLKFRLKGSSSATKFESSFMDGGFDFAYMNPYQILKANTSQGYIPLVRDIERTLNGVLVVRKDSPVHEVKDLEGARIAFPSPNALGASLVIRADLKNIHSTSVVPVYVQSHTSVYLNVLLGDVKAGGGVQKTLNKQAAEIRDELRVIYNTREITPHPVTAHSRVPVKVRELVRQAFLALGETSKGRALLSAIPIKVIGKTSLNDYQSLKEWGLDEFYQN